MIEQLLAQLRRMKVTDQAIARALGVDRSTIHRWRKGQQPHKPGQVAGELERLVLSTVLKTGLKTGSQNRPAK